jgi:hypothetical protein
LKVAAIVAKYIGDSSESLMGQPHATARYVVAMVRFGSMTTKARTFMLRAKQRHISGGEPLSSIFAKNAVAYHIGALKTKMKMGCAD